ncbi:hypothetical protein COU54_04280 [Candidatus Pacearchaeota archaeon CG10_big_fil_rev_8_21_14_0_10_31_24]|nr:MAG: hypothetical protein COU54_04280 [Candidatus Pacearchaeota archaeon CG10_big_fil_rev_8_21_14_0_10_31_24]
MILNKTPLTLAQVKEYTKDLDSTKPLVGYLKQFCKLSKSDSEKLSEEIRALNNLKIKEESIVKIVDLCPQDNEDLNKIFLEVNLTEEESKAILELVKKY